MTVKQANKELVVSFRISAETTHTQLGKFAKSILAYVSSVHYCAAVDLFSVRQSNDSFVTIIDIIGVPT